MAEQGVDAPLDRLGHHVLPAAGLDVHLLPGQPDDVDEETLRQPVLAHDPHGRLAALGGQVEVAVVLDGEQPVPLHPRHGLAHGRPGLAQPLGDAGTQRDDALLLQLEDRPEVHLGGVDEIAHASRSASS